MTALAWHVDSNNIPPVLERTDREGETDFMGYGRSGAADIYNTRGASE